MAFSALAAHVVDDFAKYVCKETVVPFTRSRVKGAIEIVLVDGFWIDNVRNAFDAIEPLERGQQDVPGVTLAASRGADHHQTMLNLLDLVELQNLRNPTLALNEAPLGANLEDLLLQGIQIHREVVHAWEYISEQAMRHVSGMHP